MRRFATTVTAIVLLASGHAYAGTAARSGGIGAIRAADRQLSIELIATTMHYSETGNGVLGTQIGLLNSEKGTIPGFALELSAMRHVFVDDVYLDARFSHVNGHTRYVGTPISGGTYGSVTGSVTATLTDARLRLGKGFAVGRNFLLTPYGEIGHHRWSRGVNDGETYTHDYWGIGALAQSEVAPGFVASAHLMLGRTFAPHIDVAGPSGFSDGLGSSTIDDVGIAGDYAWGKGVHMRLGAAWTGFKYGISGLHPIPSTYTWEPNSATRYVTISAGVGYAF